MKYFILVSLLLGGCVTPEYWEPEDHAAMMQRCRIMCKKTGTMSYDAWTAECVCHRNAKPLRFEE